MRAAICAHAYSRMAGGEQPPSTCTLSPPATRRRECICWPPSHYALESKRRYFYDFCARLPPPQRRQAHAQQWRVYLMERWLIGEINARLAAEEEHLVQQALAQRAE